MTTSPKLKPLHRSLLFWAGIFVLISMVWIWINSAKHWRELFVLRTGANLAWVLSHRGGEAGLKVLDAKSLAAYGYTPLHSATVVVYQPRYWTGRVGISSAQDEFEVFPGPGIYAPDWLLVIAAALLWAGLLRWHRRRLIKRALAMEKEIPAA